MGEVPLVFHQLTPGYRFPPVRYQLNRDMVIEYLQAVRGHQVNSDKLLVADGREAVPPTAAGVLGMRKLLSLISLPEGSLHISQEFEFKGVMGMGDLVTCQATVMRKQERGPIRLLTIDILISNEAGCDMVTGRLIISVPPDKVS
jgi:hypothetical protein